MTKIRMVKKPKDITRDELLKITGGAKFRAYESLVDMGGEYFKMSDIVDDPASPSYKIPVSVIKDRFNPNVRLVVFFGILNGEEYVVLEKYSRYKKFNFFKPGGRVMWIRKGVVDLLVRAMLTASEYEYSPDGDAIELVEIKPDRKSIIREEKYQFDARDFLDNEIK